MDVQSAVAPVSPVWLRINQSFFSPCALRLLPGGLPGFAGT